MKKIKRILSITSLVLVLIVSSFTLSSTPIYAEEESESTSIELQSVEETSTDLDDSIVGIDDSNFDETNDIAIIDISKPSEEVKNDMFESLSSDMQENIDDVVFYATLEDGTIIEFNGMDGLNELSSRAVNPNSGMKITWDHDPGYGFGTPIITANYNGVTTYLYCTEPFESWPTGQSYSIASWNNPSIHAILNYGFPSNQSGLKEKYGKSDQQAYVATFVAINAYFGQFDRNTVENAGDGYVNDLLKEADKGYELLSVTINRNNNTSTYNASKKRLESTSFFKISINRSKNSTSTIGGLPSGVYVIDANGNKLNSIPFDTNFKLATDNLSYSGTINLTVNHGIEEMALYQFTASGLQTLAGFWGVDPLPTVPFSQTFAPALGDLEVEKQDIYNVPQSNIVFEVSANKSTIERTGTTQANGKVLFEDLVDGTWYIREKSVVNNLVLVSEWKTVTVIAGQVTSEIVKNDYQRSNLTLTKVENDWDLTFPEFNGQKLEGTVISLKAKTNVYEGTTLKYLTGELIGTEVTNSAGQVKFHNLPMGDYQACELGASEGFVLFNGCWDITISYDGNNPTTAITETGVTVSNQVKYGSVELVKVNDKGTLRLEGAVFELRRTSDNKLIGTYTSDENGRIVIDNLRYSTNNGYKLIEIKSPDDYWLKSDPIYFDITEHNQIVYLVAPNTLIEAHIQGNKTNEDGLALEGVGFSIWDVKAQEFITLKYAEGNKVIEATEWFTDVNGDFFVKGLLRAGNYELVETTRLDGYKPLAPIPFTIDENQFYIDLGDLIGLSLDVGGIINEWNRGDLIIQKLDEETGLPLVNFKFNLYDSEMNLEGTYVTGDDGTVKIENLKYDVYTVEEIEALEPYVIDPDNNRQQIFIEEDGMTYTVTFRNTKAVGQHRGFKIESSSQEALGLEEAEYELYDITELGIEIELEDLDLVTPEIPDNSNIENEVADPEDSVEKVIHKNLDFTHIKTKDDLLDLLPIDTQLLDENGEFLFDNLDLSKVYASVEKWAIDKYNVSVKVTIFSFEYEDNYTPVIYHEATYENDLTEISVKIKKLDRTTGDILVSDKVEFTEYDINQLVLDGMTEAQIQKLASSGELDKMVENGEVSTRKIKGNNVDGISLFLATEGYKLYKESDAPDGYRLSDEFVFIYISGAEENQEVIIEYYNELLPVVVVPKLPSTGISDSLYFIDVLIILFGALLLVVGKRKNEEIQSSMLLPQIEPSVYAVEQKQHDTKSKDYDRNYLLRLRQSMSKRKWFVRHKKE